MTWIRFVLMLYVFMVVDSVVDLVLCRFCFGGFVDSVVDLALCRFCLGGVVDSVDDLTVLMT